jgi:hypothetical protein
VHPLCFSTWLTHVVAIDDRCLSTRLRHEWTALRGPRGRQEDEDHGREYERDPQAQAPRAMDMASSGVAYVLGGRFRRARALEVHAEGA